MKQFFCVRHDDYASGLTPGSGLSDTIVGSLAAGAFAIIARDGDTVTIDTIFDAANGTPPGALPRFFQIAYKGAGGGLQFTPELDKLAVKCVKMLHTHVQAKVVTLGTTNNFPALEENLVASIVVRNKLKPLGTQSAEKPYSYTLKYGDDAAKVWAGLMAAVNADSTRVVEATGGVSTLILTAKTAGNDFSVSVGGILRNTTNVITTANIVGTGLPADLVVIEKDAAVDRGMENGKLSLLYTKTTDIDTTKFYDLFVITGQITSKRGFNNTDNDEYELVVAIDEALTAAATTGKSRRAIEYLDGKLL